MVISDSGSHFPVEPAERRCFQRETRVSTRTLSQATAGAHLSPQAVKETGLGRGILGLGASMGHLNPTQHTRGWGGHASAFGLGWGCCLNVGFFTISETRNYISRASLLYSQGGAQVYQMGEVCHGGVCLGCLLAAAKHLGSPEIHRLCPSTPALHFCIVMFLFSR